MSEATNQDFRSRLQDKLLEFYNEYRKYIEDYPLEAQETRFRTADDIITLIEQSLPRVPTTILEDDMRSHTTYNDGIRDFVDDFKTNLGIKGDDV